MAKKLPRSTKIILTILGALICLVVIAIGGFNLYIRVSYSSFYDDARKEFSMPALNEGFVPQDLDYFESAHCWLFSGYAPNEEASAIYKQTPNGAYDKIFIEMPDGTLYSEHGSGISSTDKWVFLTCENGYIALRATDVVEASNNTTIRAEKRFTLDFSPAFLNIQNNTLYTGNFYYPEVYETPESHHLTSPDGTENPAVLYAFAADDQNPYGFSSVPTCVYSIPEKVQGVTVSEDGIMTLSTSYGIAGSHLLFYNLNDVSSVDTFNVTAYLEATAAETSPTDGIVTGAAATEASTTEVISPNENSTLDVPLYFLDSQNLIHDLEAPPMSEGIDLHDGRIYIAFESASNKYIFGKLYGAYDVYSLALSR